MEKKEILKLIKKCATKYKENLVNKNVLFVYYENAKIEYVETKFLPSNFLHLTGIKYNRKKNNNAINFYKDILQNKVSLQNIEIKDENILKLKLNVLNEIVNINYSAKMIGEYNSNIKNLLITDKVVGTINYCIGFIKTNKYYVPNTVLKEDIRSITNKANRVIAILTKNIGEEKYTNFTYLAKGVNKSNIIKNEKLMLRLDISSL